MTSNSVQNGRLPLVVAVKLIDSVLVVEKWQNFPTTKYRVENFYLPLDFIISFQRVINTFKTIF